MRLHAIAAILVRQAYLLRGSPARILPLFAWVAVDVVLGGFITRFLDEVTAARLDFVPLLLGAVLLWDFLTRVMQGVTMAFFEDVWSRNFLNFFATPLTVGEYLSGLVLSAICTSLIGLAVMLLLATTAFGLSFFVYGATLVPFVLVLFLFGIAIGIFGAGLVLRLGPASEWFVWPIPAMLTPFVGVVYPLSTLPRWMQMIGRALAPSYVFEGMRAIVAHRSPEPALLGIAIVLAIVYILLASWFFTRMYRYAVRTGLIARYSAESVS